MRRGVDGFRVDVIWHLIKDAEFRDNPPNPNFTARARRRTKASCRSIPPTSRRRMDVIAEMRRVIDEFDDRVLIGEIYLPLSIGWSPITATTCRGAHCRSISRCSPRRGARAPSARDRSRDYESGAAARRLAELGARQSRPAARRRAGWARAQARVAAMLLLTLRGTPTLYYGDEIGMQQVADRAGSGVSDPFEKNVPRPRRRPRRLPHADAVGCHRACRFLDR